MRQRPRTHRLAGSEERIDEMAENFPRPIAQFAREPPCIRRIYGICRHVNLLNLAVISDFFRPSLRAVGRQG